jgi:hypothetical protein
MGVRGHFKGWQLGFPTLTALTSRHLPAAGRQGHGPRRPRRSQAQGIHAARSIEAGEQPRSAACCRGVEPPRRVQAGRVSRASRHAGAACCRGRRAAAPRAPEAGRAAVPVAACRRAGRAAAPVAACCRAGRAAAPVAACCRAVRSGRAASPQLCRGEPSGASPRCAWRAEAVPGKQPRRAGE